MKAVDAVNLEARPTDTRQPTLVSCPLPVCPRVRLRVAARRNRFCPSVVLMELHCPHNITPSHAGNDVRSYQSTMTLLLRTRLVVVLCLICSNNENVPEKPLKGRLLQSSVMIACVVGYHS